MGTHDRLDVPLKKIRALVGAVLPLWLAGQASAAGVCTPVAGSSQTTTSGVSVGVGGQVCAGGESTLSIAAGATAGTAGATSAGAGVWVEGLGNTVNNAGTITRSSTTGNTFGLFLGDYTVARNNAANVGGTGTGAAGATTLRITPSGTLTADQLAGKQILMAGEIVDGEARPGDLRTIATATLVSGNTYDITVSGGGWSKNQAGNQFNLLAGDGPNRVVNAGDILATYTGTATANVRAVETNIAGDYVITNTGNIRATHTSIGTPQGIDAGGDVTAITITNRGLIESVRSEAIILTENLATSLRAKSATITTAANLGSATAVFSQEETEEASIVNEAAGTLRGIGAFNPAIYLRAAEQSIVNAGLIEGSRQGTPGAYTYGMAIGAVSDSGEIRTMNLTNSGTVRGDILAVNGNAYRWHALSTFTGGTNAAGLAAAANPATLDNRLLINSQWGQLDSEITNSGTVAGNLYFSNGTHVLVNRAGATLTGDIDIDQRDTTCASCSAGAPGGNTAQPVTGTFVVVGTKDFTFENAGSFAGNITIRTASSTALGGASPVASSVLLIPTITGSGGATTAAPSSSLSGLGGTLNVITSAGGGVASVELEPKVASGVVVRNQATWKAADTFQINGVTVAAGAATLPSVESANSLVSWTPSVNASGNLVLQAAVATSGVSGLSRDGRTALDTLLGFDSVLGSQVQNLAGDEAVRQAAEQVRPRVNGAHVQAAGGVTDKFFQTIDTHLAATHLAGDTGRSGIATGEQPDGTRVWHELFGFQGRQGRRDGIDGYDASAYGFSIGGDRRLDGASRAGVAFGYGQSSVQDKGVNLGNWTNVSSFQGTLYGSTLLDGMWMKGALGLARHQYSTFRSVVGSGVTGDFDAWNVTARADAGWPMQRGRITLTPVAGLAYGRLQQSAYTERGTGALAVDANGRDSLRSLLGARVLLPLSRRGVDAMSLELRALWNHEFVDSSYDTTARFVSGGGAFTTAGVQPTQNGLNLGTTFRIGGRDSAGLRQTLLLNYDAELRDQYVSHALQLRVVLDL